MDKKPEEKDIPQSDSNSSETGESKEQSTTSDQPVSEAGSEETKEQSSSLEQPVSESAGESKEPVTSEQPVSTPVAEGNTASDSNQEYVEEEDSDSLGPLFIGAIIVAIIGIAVAWFYVNQNNQATVPEQIVENPLEQFEVAQGDPDDVVLVVNGTSITRAALNRVLQQTAQQTQMQGADPSDPEIRDLILQQAIDSLVNTELVRQAAEREGFEVTEEEIDERYNDVVANTGGLEEFEAAIAELGLTEEGIRQDVANELQIEAYLNSILEPQIEISDQDIEAFYATVQAQAEEQGDLAEFPPLEEVREQIRAQLASEQEQEIIESLLDDLRESAEIETLLSE